MFAVKLIQKYVTLLGHMSAYLSVALAFVIAYDISARFLFSGGSVALQELQWHTFDLIFLLAIAYALKDDEHVRVDIFYEKYSPRTKAIINIVGNSLFIIPFSIAIVYFSLFFVEQSYLQHEISPNPDGLGYRYLIKSTIVVGFFSVILQSIASIINAVHQLKRAV